MIKSKRHPWGNNLGCRQNPLVFNIWFCKKSRDKYILHYYRKRMTSWRRPWSQVGLWYNRMQACPLKVCVQCITGCSINKTPQSSIIYHASFLSDPFNLLSIWSLQSTCIDPFSLLALIPSVYLHWSLQSTCIDPFSLLALIPLVYFLSDPFSLLSIWSIQSTFYLIPSVYLHW